MIVEEVIIFAGLMRISCIIIPILVKESCSPSSIDIFGKDFIGMSLWMGLEILRMDIVIDSVCPLDTAAKLY